MFYLVFIIHEVRKNKSLLEFYTPVDLSTIYPLKPLTASLKKHRPSATAPNHVQKTRTSFCPKQNIRITEDQ